MKKTVSIFLSIILAFSCLTCLIGGTVSAESVNLFTNGSFEDCDISKNTVSGWKSFNGGSIITVEEGEDFNYFTFTEKDDSTYSYIYNQIPVEIKKNTAYTIKFWIKTSDEAAMHLYLYEPQYYFPKENSYGKTEGPWESRNIYSYNYDGGKQRVYRTDITHTITDSIGSFTRGSASSMANLAGTEKYKSTNGQWVQVTHTFTTGNLDVHEAAVRYSVYVDAINKAQTISVGGFEMYGVPTGANVVKAPASNNYDLGYVSPANGIVANEGDEVTFTAIPYGNNRFLGWYDGDELVSDEAELTYTYSVNTPMTYEAKFAESKYTVSSSMENYADGTIVTAPAVTDDWRITLGNLQSDSNESHTGNKSVKVSADSRWGYVGRRIRNLRPNTQYTLSFWTKMKPEYTVTKDINSYMYYTLTDGNASPSTSTQTTQGVYVLNQLVRATNTWQNTTVTFNTGNTTEAVLWFNYCSDVISENTLWIDDISCSCKLEGGISVAYEDASGNDYFESQNLAPPTTKLYEIGGNTLAAKVIYDSMNGAFVFKGWYEGNTFKSSSEEYVFEQADIFAVNLTAKFIVSNVMSGAAGFESYEHDTNMRVEPPNQAVPPTGDKWGVHYSGYEGDKENFGARIVRGSQANNYISSLTYTPEQGTKTTESSETVMPYSGDSMLGLNYKFRRLVRKIDNLKANTEYTVSFYVYNADAWNFLSRALVANTYDLISSTISLDDSKIYGYYEANCYEEYYHQNAELVNKNEVRQWHRVDISFTTGNDTSSVYLHFASQTKLSSAKFNTFIDNLVCYETVFNKVGNAIRAVQADTPQALRYKFTIDNDKLNGFADYKTSEIGLLAMSTECLNDKELILNGQYSFQGEKYSPVKGTIDLNKNLQYVDGDTSNTYFTGALYNIGYNGVSTNYNYYGVNYTVRPYILYTADDGRTAIIYGNAMSSSVFDVVYAIRDSRLNKSDLKVADDLLEEENILKAYKDWQPRNGWYLDKEPVTDYAYSMAVIGDIQNTSQYYPEDLHYIYDWIIDNKDSKNIQYVLGLGDITNSSTTAEYNAVESQLTRLTQAGIPQTIVRGNHDREHNYYNFITQDKYGAVLGGEFGSYDNTMSNTYRIVNISGIKYMMLVLDFYPSPEEVAWACGVVEAHPDCNVIVSTHGYLSSKLSYLGDDVAYGKGGGQYIHDNLVVKYENIVMVLCGHELAHGPSYRITTGDHGNKVVEMLIDPQDMDKQRNRACGMIAMFYFSNDGKTVKIEYFSAVTGEYYKEKYQFKLDLHTVQ